MGNYFFTDTSGNEVKVEYTFGYKLIDGNLKIDVHHSSFPLSALKLNKMFNKLYFICPTDNIESIINSKLNDNNFYITSLANSITFNYDFIKELHSIIESKKISEITFVLSDDNKLINDALENKKFKNIRSLNHLNLKISSQKKFL